MRELLTSPSPGPNVDFRGETGFFVVFQSLTPLQTEGA